MLINFMLIKKKTCTTQPWKDLDSTHFKDVENAIRSSTCGRLLRVKFQISLQQTIQTWSKSTQALNLGMGEPYTFSHWRLDDTKLSDSILCPFMVHAYSTRWAKTCEMQRSWARMHSKISLTCPWNWSRTPHCCVLPPIPTRQTLLLIWRGNSIAQQGPSGRKALWLAVERNGKSSTK